VLRLVERQFSYRQIAKDLRISKTTVMDIVKRYKLQEDSK
jgi:transposase